MGVDFVLHTGWKITLFAVLVAIAGLLMAGFVSFVGGHVTTALTSMGSPQVASFVPANFTQVITIMLSVKATGTVYIAAMNFVDRKAAVLA